MLVLQDLASRVAPGSQCWCFPGGPVLLPMPPYLLRTDPALNVELQILCKVLVTTGFRTARPGKSHRLFL